MGLRLELRETGFEGTVAKIIPLKPGDTIKLAAFPLESMSHQRDSSGRMPLNGMLTQEEGIRRTSSGKLVVDGLIRVTSDQKDKVVVVELVKIVKTRPMYFPYALAGGDMPKGGEVEEVVGRYRDDGSFGARKVFVTDIIGRIRIPRELPGLLVSDIPRRG